MARRNRMQVLQKLAEHTEAEASRRLAERLKLLDGDEKRLEQIRSYLADYSGGSQGNSPAMSRYSGIRLNSTPHSGALGAPAAWRSSAWENASSSVNESDATVSNNCGSTRSPIRLKRELAAAGLAWRLL